MRTVHHILLAAVTLLLLAIPVLAHHSFSSEFDANKKISIDGVISKVELINPHGYVHVDVKDPKTGKITTWLFETHGPTIAPDGIDTRRCRTARGCRWICGE